MSAYTDSLGAQIEKVTPALEGLFDNTKALYSRMDTSMEDVEVSGRGARCAMYLRPGGVSRSYDDAGGSYGTGGNLVTDHVDVTAIPSVHVIEWDEKSAETTDTKSKSTFNFVERLIADAMTSVTVVEDKWLNTAGDGVLATIGTWTVGTLTADLSSPFYYQLLRDNDTVTVYPSSPTAARGEVTISRIYQATNKAVLSSSLGATVANGDTLRVAGLTGASPTFLNGLPYNASYATTGTFYTWNRANYPETWTPAVNASSTDFNSDHFMRLTAQMEGILPGVFDDGDWFVYGSEKQHYQYTKEIRSMVNVFGDASSTTTKNVDAVVQRKLNKMVGGYDFLPSAHADQTRIDLICANNWRRIEYKKLGWKKNDNGGTVFPKPTTDTYKSAFLSFITWKRQYAIKNPRKHGVVYGLNIPTLT